MSTQIDVSTIPSDKREAYVRLHLQNAARSLGYASGSQEESDYVSREARNVLKNGHPMTITVTADQLRDIQG